MLTASATGRPETGNSTSGTRGRIAHPGIQVLPGVAAEKPDSRRSPRQKHDPEREMGPRLHRRRPHARKIPLCERPDKLPIKADTHQNYKKEADQRQYANAKRVKQNHRPMVHAGVALDGLRSAFRDGLSVRGRFPCRTATGTRRRR